MSARNGPPQANSPAPDWLFLPDPAIQLWYGQPPGQSSAETARIDMPTGMFERTAFGP